MKVVALFAGAGGFDLGIIQAGHEVIWANDIDQDSVDTYRKNIGSHIICDDIANIPSIDIPISDVVIGGFPCQGFSQANLKRSPSDERNKLYLQFLRVIRDNQPKYFLAENVRGILTIDSGNAIKQITSDFSDAGYIVSYRLFNMADFGVPQIRFRVIIVGTRQDLPSSCAFTFPEPTHAKKPSLLIPLSWITISEALQGIPEPEVLDSGLVNHVCSKYKVTNRDFTGHRWTDPNRPSPTILARGNGKGGVCAIQHPGNHRRLSVRESAIIQMFPLDFEFTGGMNSCYRQVGNAVPIVFAKHLGMELKVLERGCQECV